MSAAVPRNRRDRRPVQAAAVLALLTLAVLIASRSLVLPWVIDGPSMRPALEPGDRVLVDLWTYRQRAPRPGEVALFFGPGGMPMVKRVAVALPPEARGAGPGTFWMLGDNPAGSTDSRQFGAVERARVRGRVLVRYWPPGRAGPLRGRR